MKSELNFTMLYGMAHTFLINIGRSEWPKMSQVPVLSQIKLPLSKQRALIIRPWRAGSLSYGCSGAHFASRIGPWGSAGAAQPIGGWKSERSATFLCAISTLALDYSMPEVVSFTVIKTYIYYYNYKIFTKGR